MLLWWGSVRGSNGEFSMTEGYKRGLRQPNNVYLAQYVLSAVQADMLLCGRCSFSTGTFQYTHAKSIIELSIKGTIPWKWVYLFRWLQWVCIKPRIMFSDLCRIYSTGMISMLINDIYFWNRKSNQCGAVWQAYKYTLMPLHLPSVELTGLFWDLNHCMTILDEMIEYICLCLYSKSIHRLILRRCSRKLNSQSSL
jgi:hypothetical protein